MVLNRRRFTKFKRPFILYNKKITYVLKNTVNFIFCQEKLHYYTIFNKKAVIFNEKGKIG